ncbi:hypothetical protein AB0L05_04440 [Nonomuraea pusilla]|uniref:hypothetical protein n=1 Tax=Nonomuraea pusilla TaxID=46177 RepID=UPI0033177C28
MRELRSCGSHDLGWGTAAAGCVPLGDGTERLVRLCRGVGVREGLGGAQAGGEQPEEVAEIAGDQTVLALGTDVDDGL